MFYIHFHEDMAHHGRRALEDVDRTAYLLLALESEQGIRLRRQPWVRVPGLGGLRGRLPRDGARLSDCP
jgi:hypothetical protein